MRKLLFLSLIIFTSCNKDYETLIQKTWLPITVKHFDGQSVDSEFLLFSLTFSDSGKIISRTLGTDYELVSDYRILENQIEFSHSEGVDTIDIVSIGNNHLELELDSFNIITYHPFPIANDIELSHTIRKQLIDQSWYWNDPNYYNECLIEFKDSLEDKIIKYHLRDKLAAAGVHIFQNNYTDFKINSAWGVNHFMGNNILSLREVDGGSFNNLIFITEVTDSIISGFRFHENNKKQVTLKKAIANTNKLNGLISNNWKLDSYEKIEDNGSSWSNNGNDVEKSLKISDLRDKKIIMDLRNENRFLIRSGQDTVTIGEWRLSTSGRLIELTSYYYENGHDLVRNHFLTILEVDSNNLKIFRRENIDYENNEYGNVKFIENYKSTGGNKR
ncbi:MAG: hypothetical protein ACFB2Y_19125 [Fulvivirga sp.]